MEHHTVIIRNQNLSQYISHGTNLLIYSFFIYLVCGKAFSKKQFSTVQSFSIFQKRIENLCTYLIHV